MVILKRLDILWRDCDLQIAFKINVLDAVMRAKLSYGMESAQLTPSHQRRIEVFQLKGLRKILKMQTTYVERNNTNAEVFRRANEEFRKGTTNDKPSKIVKPFVTCYLNSRMKRLARIHKMNHNHAVRHVTFAPDPDHTIKPWTLPNRRVGRPRFNWVTETIKDMWNNIKHEHTHTHTYHKPLTKTTNYNMRP